MKILYLYTTAGCHLCEQAKQLMWPVLEQHGYRLQEIEIADDDKLVEKYGIRIPVVRCQHGEGELGWPFNERELDHYLRAEPG